MVEEKKINKKFGKKILNLFQLINADPDWEKYVQPKTANVVKTVYRNQSMINSEKELDMRYITIRSHLIKAAERIKDKNLDFKQGGGGEHAQELFTLMDETAEWKDYVTNHEAELAEKFKEVKNFYEVARQFNLSAGNIAGTLYGTTQKIGVINKIKQKIQQVDRRNIDLINKSQ